MALQVQKFGGTSVGTPEKIQLIARHIHQTRRRGHSVVAVVSAMGDTTDELIALAQRISQDPPHREMDMLLTAGERISMALLSIALHELGEKAVSFTGSQSGIITTDHHRRARIRRILGDRVRAAIQDDRVAIVAGFQGVSEKKEVTTLGRGGSDTSAVALAVALRAERCEIYTDVDGVYTADPSVVPTARLHPRIPADLMIELAWRGAGVLHPRSVELARQFGIPVWVRNSLADSRSGASGEGTEIMSKDALSIEGGLEEFSVAGVSADRERALLSIELMRSTAASAVWDLAREHQLSVLAPVFTAERLQFFAFAESERDWVKGLQRLAADGFVKSFQFDSGTVPLSIVGTRFSQDGTALQQVTETLAQSGIFATMGSASASAITVAVPGSHADDGVRALHQRFLDEEKSR